MAKSKKNIVEEVIKENFITQEIITDTLEKNFMPYAMTAILARAIPQIDGFKPSHRKLLYTMYKMNLLSKSVPVTKSANVVGQTMKLNPHGEGAIYETLVRLTRGNEALLHPFIESKGSFGKQYSRDMAYAASRYTQCKLDELCNEIFDGIDRDAIDFMDNYDNTTKEPVLLPTAFPNILVAPNQGLAVGMASQICSFNLAEICDVTIKLIKETKTTTDEILKILKAPDFSTGAQIIYNEEIFKEIYETGRGSFKLRARYNYDKGENRIEIYQIPYTATIEAIMDKIITLVKDGKIRDINDIRDETDLGGLKLTIDLKRGADHEKLMARLFKATQLEDNFPCNFNVLIGSTPAVLGIKGILEEWTAFRTECIRREYVFDLKNKQEKLHLLTGLRAIILDIDKAIKIIRETEKDGDVIPNLMKGFGIDRAQAEYVSEIRLRNINKEFLLSKIKETDHLAKEIKEIEEILNSNTKIKNIIIKQLENIKKKYGKPRFTQIVYDDIMADAETDNEIPDYNVFAVMSKEGYFKKITMQSMRGNDEQKLKDGDELLFVKEISNNSDILFFTNMGQVYKYKINDFDNIKASVLGDYIPAKLGFERDEKIVLTVITEKYAGKILLFFENGKAAKIPLSAYETKTNRKKLTNAYSTQSPLAFCMFTENEESIAVFTEDGRAAVIKTNLIPEKTTRTTIGVDTFYLNKNQKIKKIFNVSEEELKENYSKYVKTKLPARNVVLDENQLKLDI